MTKSLIITLVASISVLSGCTPSVSNDPISPAEDAPSIMDDMAEIREMLRGKAETLAEEELGRIMAAELMYRNVAEFFRPIHKGRQSVSDIWVKQYHHFNDYEIKDIYRSDSYLYPIVFEIHYLYNYYATDYYEVSMTLSMAQAKQMADVDQNFKLIKSDRLIRRYRCDENGNYVGNLPELPPRPTYEIFPTGERISEPNEGIANPLPPF